MIDASGRDTRGQGNANATIVVTMNDEGDGTRVDVVTDLAITGKVAQFGRGVLDDVSAKLLRQFVENLERDVLSSADSGAEPAVVGDDVPVSANGSSSPAATGPRLIVSEEVEPDRPARRRRAVGGQARGAARRRPRGAVRGVAPPPPPLVAVPERRAA